MKLRQSCVQDRCLRVVQDEWWPYNVANVCDFFCIWSMRACEFNNVLTTVQVAIYSTATIFYFALYLHCISLVIALHVQLQFKRGYEIPRPYVNT